MKDRMIAYCGLDCVGCPAYIATKANDEEKIRETAEEWSEHFKAEVRPDDVWCDGCTAGGRKSTYCGNMCQIRVCATKKRVVSCAHCADYSCNILDDFLAKIPHEQAKKNLEDIREVL